MKNVDGLLGAGALVGFGHDCVCVCVCVNEGVRLEGCGRVGDGGEACDRIARDATRKGVLMWWWHEIFWANLNFLQT